MQEPLDTYQLLNQHSEASLCYPKDLILTIERKAVIPPFFLLARYMGFISTSLLLGTFKTKLTMTKADSKSDFFAGQSSARTLLRDTAAEGIAATQFHLFLYESNISVKRRLSYILGYYECALNTFKGLLTIPAYSSMSCYALNLNLLNQINNQVQTRPSRSIPRIVELLGFVKESQLTSFIKTNQGVFFPIELVDSDEYGKNFDEGCKLAKFAHRVFLHYFLISPEQDIQAAAHNTTTILNTNSNPVSNTAQEMELPPPPFLQLLPYNLGPTNPFSSNNGASFLFHNQHRQPLQNDGNSSTTNTNEFVRPMEI